MRKVIYSVGVSLDGYIADPNGGVEWLERATSKAKGEDFGMGAFFKSIDTVLMGRKTYEIALKLGMPEGGYRGQKNYIFSRTLPPGERKGAVYTSAGPAQVVSELRQKPGKHIWLCGGGQLAREFLKAGVLDEITLGLVPRMIGNGLPTFPPGFDETELELTKVKKFKGGVVGLTYRVVRAGETSAASSRKPARSAAGKSRSAKSARQSAATKTKRSKTKGSAKRSR